MRIGAIVGGASKCIRVAMAPPWPPLMVPLVSWPIFRGRYQSFSFLFFFFFCTNIRSFLNTFASILLQKLAEYEKRLHLHIAYRQTHPKSTSIPDTKLAVDPDFLPVASFTIWIICSLKCCATLAFSSFCLHHSQQLSTIL